MDYRVMVIGANEISISELASLLEEAGMEVIKVCNGSWCLDRVDEMLPGAIVVEEEAGSKAWEISSQIRHELDVPIILLGTSDSELAWVKAAAYGVDCYLSRPFSPIELVARIKALIRRYENNQHRFIGMETQKVVPWI